jgi:hypothetical protein
MNYQTSSGDRFLSPSQRSLSEPAVIHDCVGEAGRRARFAFGSAFVLALAAPLGWACLGGQSSDELLAAQPSDAMDLAFK